MTLIEGDGGHAFITEQGGAACGISETPYVSNCGYNQAEAILAWIYGPLVESSAEPSGRFILFDQGAYSRPGTGFADEGMVYVPQACTDAAGLPGACRAAWLRAVARERGGRRDLHQGLRLRRGRRPEPADRPLPASQVEHVNPHGCWDWWGYTGLDYLGKDAPQIKSIWTMVEQLAAAP